MASWRTSWMFVMAIALVGHGQPVLITSNVTVANQNPVVLNCTLDGYSGVGATVDIRKAIGVHSAANKSIVENSILLSLESAQYSDNGQYICMATILEALADPQTISKSFYVNIQGYEAPRKRGVGQFGLVKTSEQTLVDCPVVGVPGPVMFYWERGEDLFNTTGYKRVTMATNVTTGPFVNEQGQLDLSRTTVEDSMFYLCTGVDVAGANASQLFRIEVVARDDFVLWVQWYMILAYCVVGMLIAVLLILVVWFICANRQECYIRVTKRVTVKERVRREEVISQFLPPLQQTFDIGTHYR